ncbi:ABC transporter substrate-binding protein [Marivita hallyeonensis]|uniref:Iron complex transport system substrate-binding protein n=1 Tax=Marivita hallyeonensis TaxID=996342 RepID=A0A1M5LM72_9RHOB|nr:ABC transporter substrate-binding protein [Marivita hallyeonensis]SHG66000.1 iron complex transport system substrate-binding protein [Marivita hallyeonensis]
MRRLLTLIITTLAATVASASDLPKVVSVNVCTDQYVLLLADNAQILSLSRLADDPFSSAMAARAKDFPKTAGNAEAIAMQQPDLVVASEWTDPALVTMLRAIGVEVLQVSSITRLDQIPDHLRLMGQALAQEDRAEALAQTFAEELAQYRLTDGPGPLAAFYYPNGYALGAGTLSHDILTHGGARNLSVELGMQGGGRLSLEQVVLLEPDFLIGSPSYNGHSRSEEVTQHPAIDGVPILQSSAEWSCGTPSSLNAALQVREMVKTVEAAQTTDK